MVRIQAPDSSKDVSFHVLFHVKFGHTGCCVILVLIFLKTHVRLRDF